MIGRIATCVLKSKGIASNPLRLVAFCRKPQLHPPGEQLHISLLSVQQGIMLLPDQVMFRPRNCLKEVAIVPCCFWGAIFLQNEKQYVKRHEENLVLSKDSQLFQLFLLPISVFGYPKLPQLP